MARFSLVMLLVISIFSGCSSDQPATPPPPPPKPSVPFQIVAPSSQQSINWGDSLFVELGWADSIQVDSIVGMWDSERMGTFSSKSFTISAAPKEVGLHNLIFQVHAGDLKGTRTLPVVILAGSAPQEIEWSFVAMYPHEKGFFTEGLVFHEGALYEGTGDWGESGIFKTDLRTGKIIKQQQNQGKIFGEGISIVNGKLIQLTYQAMEGYVYDLKTFNKLQSFPYSKPTEGWGMTFDGTSLIFSNGSNRLMYMDTASYVIQRELQIYDHEAPVDSLNELEYVDGFIYANIWMRNEIVKIDAQTGAVVGTMDLTKLVPQGLVNHPANVLNGIAYRPDNGHLLITGKRWPSLFEISIKEPS
ncbi:glutaminyl-peptide cyclotransferase [Pontibacter sp. G13]|uniref:glutaminyl-peptide cyclotransferase n=1 Tax=Pontibacter sp. G13 TaxID=3074898 RepID=UPI00288A0FC9|nr:glutaminyl-peptide cyclotransferase [Pontibacter sp. G13]WNJ20293.1 glutaminyl-peptide cyclotransferase [Pontibacter sp. G13]